MDFGKIDPEWDKDEIERLMSHNVMTCEVDIVECKDCWTIGTTPYLSAEYHRRHKDDMLDTELVTMEEYLEEAMQECHLCGEEMYECQCCHNCETLNAPDCTCWLESI